MNGIAQFTRGNHAFSITVAESCTIRTVTLSVQVEVRRDANPSREIAIFIITQGDHVWNTLVGDHERDGLIDLAPCIPYLQLCAEEFCREHPEPRQFGSTKKAEEFSDEVLRRPVALRGSAPGGT